MYRVPCLFCNNDMGLAIEGREEYMQRHVSPRVVHGAKLHADSTGHIYLSKPEIQLLEWWLCPVCQTSWEMFPTAREEINVAASNAAN